MGSLTMNRKQNGRLLWSAVVMGMLGLLLLTACHTTAGFGQDMQSAGRNIQNSANKHNQ